MPNTKKQTNFINRAVSKSLTIEQLTTEIEKEQARLDKELEQEANTAKLLYGKTTKSKMFKASRITAYKLVFLRNKLEQKLRLERRLDLQNLQDNKETDQITKDIEVSYDKLDATLNSLEFKIALRKNIKNNIVERVIAKDVTTAQILLKRARKLDQEITKMKKEI